MMTNPSPARSRVPRLIQANCDGAPSRARLRVRACLRAHVAANFGNFRSKGQRRANERAPDLEVRRRGGSRGLGRTYFFLAELDLLLLELLLELDVLFFAPPDFEAVLAILCSPSDGLKPFGSDHGSEEVRAPILFPSCSVRTNRIRTYLHRRSSAADLWS